MFDKAILSFDGGARSLCEAGLFELLRAILLCGQACGLALVIVHVWEGSSLYDQFSLIVLFACCFIAAQLIRTIENRVMDDFATRSSEDLRSVFLDAIVRLGPVGVASSGAAALTANMVEGIQGVADYVRVIIPKTVSVIIVPFVILVVIFFFDWISGLIALVCYPFILLYMRLIGSTAKAQANKRQRQFERMSNSFIDAAHGIDTITAFGTVETFGRSIMETSERFRKLTMKTLRIAMLSSTVLDIFSTLALAAVAIMLGFRLVEGTITFFPALIVLMLVPDYFKPIKDFGSDYHASLEGRASLKALRDVIVQAQQVPPVIQDGDPDPDTALVLSAEGLVFDYPENHLAWNDLDLHVQKPSRIGIFGPSGCGKTTLLNLIAGFCDPTEGHIRVNYASFDTLKRTSWLRRVAYIPQAPTLFNTSLRENLVFYNTDVSSLQIEEAISAVGLSDLVQELPQGLDTIIGTGGRDLSGGEAQRIALARALLAPERDVWILDEPTAHLDIQTECELKERILSLMGNRLVFLSTHRLHWMSDMDVVIALPQEDRASEEVSYVAE